MPPYFVLTSADLPPLNLSASGSNPLRGFLTSPDWMFDGKPEAPGLTSSLEYYLIGLDRIIDGPDSFAGFDTYLEPRLERTASKSRHAVLRFVLDVPDRPSHVPQYLIDGGLGFNWYEAYGGGASPDYSDENLLSALASFIAEFGRRYDGDPRVGFIQAGLLGFWGEWHTYTPENGEEGWITAQAKNRVLNAFDEAFGRTKIQARVPTRKRARSGKKFGLHDDSFAFATLDGEANGGVGVRWFFWPKVVRAKYDDFWKEDAMSAELYPALQDVIFENDYPRGTEYHQDFDECVRTTHATYVINHHAFYAGYTGDALWRARRSSDAMGYAFRLSGVEAVYRDVPQRVDLTLLITQAGVAPFYYPLSVSLFCCVDHTCWPYSAEVGGVQDVLLEPGEEGRFVFESVPATETCLNWLTVELLSPWAYPDRPVRFAQGDRDGKVAVTVSLPPEEMAWGGQQVAAAAATAPSTSTGASEQHVMDPHIGARSSRHVGEGETADPELSGPESAEAQRFYNGILSPPSKAESDHNIRSHMHAN